MKQQHIHLEHIRKSIRRIRGDRTDPRVMNYALSVCNCAMLTLDKKFPHRNISTIVRNVSEILRSRHRGSASLKLCWYHDREILLDVPFPFGAYSIAPTLTHWNAQIDAYEVTPFPTGHLLAKVMISAYGLSESPTEEARFVMPPDNFEDDDDEPEDDYDEEPYHNDDDF